METLDLKRSTSTVPAKQGKIKQAVRKVVDFIDQMDTKGFGVGMDGR